jgi:hypothetical protein
MVSFVSEEEWQSWFIYDGDYSIRAEFVGGYVAISYISDRVGEGGVHKLGNSWVKFRGVESADLLRAIPFLAASGCGKIWLDTVSAPDDVDMTKVQRTYESASVVFGVLNRADSQHFLQVLDTMRVLQETLERPKKSLPAPYLEQQRLSPPSRAHYKSAHTYWTRIWPFAELAVAQNFTYVVRNRQDGYEKVPLPQIRNALHRLRLAFASIPPDASRFSPTVKKLIQTDVNAAVLHVSRFTFQKTGAVTDAEDLFEQLIDAPRHALDWSSMMGAVSVFDRRIKYQKSPASRLVHIVEILIAYGIVNQPTLGQYKAQMIRSSFLPPINHAKWSNVASEFVGGNSTSTTVLTRLGRVIGRHDRTENSIFPDDWMLEDAYIIESRIYMHC